MEHSPQQITGTGDLKTLLHLASEDGHLDAVNTLVAKRQKGSIRSAYIDKKDENGKTALQLAVSRGHSDVVSYLLLEKADVGPVDELLRLAVRKTNTDASLIETLLSTIPQPKRAACVNATDMNGNSAVHLAAGKRNLGSVQHLLNAGGKVTLLNESDETPLMIAAYKGNLDIVKLLVENVEKEGISRQSYVNMKDNANNNALNKAIFKGHPDVVCYLLDEKADKGSLTNLIRFSVQSTMPNSKVLEILLKELPDTSRDGCVNAAEGAKGYTAMHWAAKNANVEFIDQLLKAGGKVSTVDDNGQTPLMLAAHECNVSLVKYILDAFDAEKEGMNKFDLLNMQDKGGQTALDLASRANVRVRAGLNCFVHSDASESLVTYLTDECVSATMAKWHGYQTGDIEGTGVERKA